MFPMVSFIFSCILVKFLLSLYNARSITHGKSWLLHGLLVRSFWIQWAYLTVIFREFLWGYEDELACIKESTATYEDSIVDDDFFGDSFVDSFDDDSFDDDEGFFDADDEESDEEPATKFVQDTKYRNKDTGKCMFGVLAGKNSSWSRSIKAKDGSRSIFEKGSIMAVNDAKTFGIWKSGSKCDSIEGMQEPSMTPPLQSLISKSN